MPFYEFITYPLTTRIFDQGLIEISEIYICPSLPLIFYHPCPGSQFAYTILLMAISRLEKSTADLILEPKEKRYSLS